MTRSPNMVSTTRRPETLDFLPGTEEIPDPLSAFMNGVETVKSSLQDFTPSPSVSKPSVATTAFVDDLTAWKAQFFGLLSRMFQTMQWQYKTTQQVVDKIVSALALDVNRCY
eukprot:gene25335-31779_t